MIAFAVQPWKPALMTLESGDLLITGTPEGVTPSGHFPHLREGDVVGTYSGLELFVTYTAGDGNDVAFTTVPEPAGMVLLGAAAAALSLTTRRRRDL